MRPHGVFTTVLLTACVSTKFQVADKDFFTDGYALDKKTLQLVESHEDRSLMLPAEARFERNCAAAEAKARERHRAAYPQSKDEGVRLSARFDRNAGCTVRMAFRKE